MSMAPIENSLPELLTISMLIFIFIFSWILVTFKRLESRPGPRPWPVLGNLHQLGNLPHRTLADWAKKYGPIMFLRLGSVPTVVASSPAMAKEFLKTHDLIFATKPHTAAGKYLFYNHMNVGFGPYGENWRQLRKLCTMELLTRKRVESFGFVREEEVSAMVRSIREKSERGMRSVDISKSVTVLTSNIICRMFSSRTYADHEFSQGHSFKEMVDELFVLAGVFCIGDFIPSLRWLDLQGIQRRMKKVFKIFDNFAEKIIDEHINHRRKEKQEQEGRVKDMVDVLLDLTEAESERTGMKITRIHMKALITEMLIAGIDTLSASLEWTMTEMLKNPRTLARVQEELESVVGRHRFVKECDLASCKYLQCIVKETYRLHPPAPLLGPREAREGSTVGGYYIPPKTRVAVNVWAIGRDGSVWEDPEEFKPERFIGNDIDLKGQDFELLPFGSGRRGCPGILAGLKGVELALSQLVHCFDWQVEGEVNMEEAFGLTVPRKHHLVARPAWRLTCMTDNEQSKVL